MHRSISVVGIGLFTTVMLAGCSTNNSGQPENKPASTIKTVSNTVLASTAAKTSSDATTKSTTETAKQKQLDKEYQEGYSAFFADSYTKAIALESDVIKQDPKYYQAYNVKGIALSYSGHFTEGMQYINESLKLHPNYGYGQFNHSLSLELWGYYDQAIPSYKKTIQIGGSPWVMWSYYGIAAIYGRRGDVKDTDYWLAKAIALDPAKIKMHARTEQDFNNVRGSKAFQALIS